MESFNYSYLGHDQLNFSSQCNLSCEESEKIIRRLYNLIFQNDLLMLFSNAKTQGARGIILWGSSHDLKSRFVANET